MNEYWLIISFAGLALLALSLALYPLRRNIKLIIIISPLFTLLLGLSYWHWGSFTAFLDFKNQLAKQQRVALMLKSVGGTNKLIAQLKARVEQTPNVARGWYLLGRLYLSQNQTIEARRVFKRAYELEPKNELIALNYAETLVSSTQDTLKTKGLNILKQILEQNKNQPDALSILAMDAYTRHAYKDAISYWERLVKLSPPQSEVKIMIQKAILDAKKRLRNMSNGT